MNENNDSQTQRHQTDGVAGVVNDGWQLDDGFKVAGHMVDGWQMALVVIGVVVPLAVQVTIASGVL
jgi:hypothetical protein